MRAIYDFKVFFPLQNYAFCSLRSKEEPKKILLALSYFVPFWFVEKRSLQRSRGIQKINKNKNKIK
jgi:hypothetical protein